MTDLTPEPLSDYHATTQRFASLLVAITTALGEPGDTLFGDLPRLAAERRARINEWRAILAEIVDAVGAPEDTRFDVLPEVVRARIADMERESGFMLGQANNNARRWGTTEVELIEARDWATWFAAEAAYWKTEADLYHTVAAQNYENDGITVASLGAERTELWARVAELERDLEWARTAEANTLDIANRNIAAYALVRADLDTARRWAAWFAAERDQTQDYLSQAAEFLQETADECEAFRARVAELEAAQAEPVGYVVGYVLDDGFASLNDDCLYAAPADAAVELAAARAEAPATPFRVFELREVPGA